MINASVHPFNVARKQNAAWEFNNCHCMPAGAEKMNGMKFIKYMLQYKSHLT